MHHILNFSDQRSLAWIAAPLNILVLGWLQYQTKISVYIYLKRNSSVASVIDLGFQYILLIILLIVITVLHNQVSMVTMLYLVVQVKTA